MEGGDMRRRSFLFRWTTTLAIAALASLPIAGLAGDIDFRNAQVFPSDRSDARAILRSNGSAASSLPPTVGIPALTPLARPAVVSTQKINSGDTAWMLTSTALVLLMTIPGLALFYGGMVRRKNVLATLMQSFSVTCLVTVLWMVIGYSLSFQPGNAWVGSSRAFLLDGVAFLSGESKVSVSHLAPSVPEAVYVMFQLTFAIITPALIAGAFAERMKFWAMLWFMGLWSVFVYCPIAHVMWETSTGYYALKGVCDFAGGTVVHISAGIAGLAAALALGRRVDYGKVSMPPHDLGLTLTGASLLWVGWFGFNAGSAGAADGRAAMAMMATQFATAAAALSWMLTEWIFKGKPSVLGIVTGALAGLVAITPASGFVGPRGALVIGIVAGIVCFWATTSLKRAFRYDDSLDAFGVHCFGGIVGALLLPIFNVKQISGVDASFLVQLEAVGATLAYSGIASYVLLKLVDWFVGLRVTEEEEREGLDISVHGERVV
jgi:Amt family ammonium transporter